MRDIKIKLIIYLVALIIIIQPVALAIVLPAHVAHAEETINLPDTEDLGGGTDQEYQATDAIINTYDAINESKLQIEHNKWQYFTDMGLVPRELVDIFELTNKLEELVLGSSQDKIFFENPLDQFALFGEPCQPKDSSAWICAQSEGNDWIRDTRNHAGDDVFANGVWDGPLYDSQNKKFTNSLVDARIIELLRYLVTPTWQSGAGRERIGIKKIVQFTENDKEIKKKNTQDEGGEEPETQKSLHYLGKIVEGKRLNTTIKAIDFSQVNSIRITTKITKKKRVGSSKTSYRFQQPFPIKVAWQDDYGQERAGIPSVDLMSGSEDLFKDGILSLLEEMDLGEALKPDDLKDADLRDIVSFVGGELIGQVLNTKSGSLKGFDFTNTLENFGRSVIADELGLPRQAFESGNSVDDIERNIGRSTLETRFKLPENSLIGKNSNEILTNVGRRWLEEEVFAVSPGTLNFTPKNPDDFYERLGAGKLEYQFNFKPGLFASNDFDIIKNNGGLRFDLVFNKNGKNDATIDEQMGVTTSKVGGNTVVDRKGSASYSPPDDTALSKATEKFRKQGPGSNSEVKNYKNIIGRRVLESSIGLVFNQKGNNQLVSDLAKGNDWSKGLGALNAGQNTNALPMQYKQLLENFQQLNPDKDPTGYMTTADLGILLNSDAVKYRGPNMSETPLEKIAESNSIYVSVPEINQAVQQIYNALTNDYVIISNTAEKLHEGTDITDPDSYDPTRKTLIDAIDMLKSKAYDYIDTTGRILLAKSSSPADEGYDLVPNPFLVQAGYAPNSIAAKLSSGDLSVLPAIGLMKIAQYTAGNNSESEAMIEVSMFEHAKSLFNNVSTTAQKFGLGLSESELKSKFGLFSGDYEKVFLLGLGDDVFERIGQSELLAAIWKQQDVKEELDNFKKSGTYQDIEEYAGELNQDVGFYNGKLNNIFSLTQGVQNKVQNLDQAGQKIMGATIGDFMKNFNNLSLSSVGAAKVFANDTQVGLSSMVGAVNKLIDSGNTGADSIWQDMNKIRHNFQEISAGRNLSYDPPSNINDIEKLDYNYSQNSGSNNKPKVENCWSGRQLMKLLTGNDFQSSLKSGLEVVGACELDGRLSLPAGSLYYFLNNSTHDYDNFTYSIGQANFIRSNKPIPANISDVQREGASILTSQVVYKLTMQSGFFSSLSKKYPMTGQAIFSLISGRPEEAATLLGGSMIDSRLRLSPGTMAEMIDPCNSELITKISGRDCQNPADRENVRIQVLAREGFKQMGFDLDLPRNIDLKSGNLKDNLAKAKLESELNLTNFTGNTFDELIRVNSTSAIVSGFGISPTPFLTLISNLLSVSRRALAQAPYVGDVNNSNMARIFGQKAHAADGPSRVELQQLISDLKRIYDYEEDLLLRSVRLKNPEYYYWTAKSVTDISGSQEITNEDFKLSSISSGLYNRLPVEGQKLVDAARNRSNNDLALEMYTAAVRFRANIAMKETRLFNVQDIDNNHKVANKFADFGISRFGGNLKKLLQGDKNDDGDVITPKYLVDNYGDMALWDMGFRIFKSQIDDSFIGRAVSEFGQYLINVNEKDNSNKRLDVVEFFTDGNIWTDTNRTETRSRFYDQFLAKTFSSKFDEQSGFETGTIRNIFVQPYLAKEIMIDQGIGKLASEVFEVDKNDNNDMRFVKKALLESFNAGFSVSCSSKTLTNQQKSMCITSTTDYYTLDFNQNKSLQAFEGAVTTKLQGILNDRARNQLGVTIPLSDVSAIARGDLNTLAYVAAAYTIKQTNDGVVTTRSRNSQSLQRFVSYDVARLATVGNINSPAVTASGDQAFNNYHNEIYTFYCESDPVCLTQPQTNDSLAQAISKREGISKAEALVRYQSGLKGAKQSGINKANRAIKEQAAKKLQFSMIDAGLYKFDENFPIGFAESFFGSGATEQGRNDAALLFVINKATANNDTWKNFLGGFAPNGNFTLETVRSFQNALNGLSCASGTPADVCRQQFFSTIITTGGLSNFAYSQMNTWFAGAFGSGLERDIFDGLLAYGYTGDLDGSFTYKDARGKNITVSSLTDTVEDWASNKIFGWADSSLNFDAGVAKGIYENGMTFYDAYKRYDYVRSHSALEVGMNDALTHGGNPRVDLFDNNALTQKGADVKKQATAKFKQAQAQFVSFVATSIFKSQIANMESKLGLVPGTGAMAVSMLVNLAMGVPVDPITIFLFIGMNLFGYYKTAIKVYGTADGYYPFVGHYGDYTFGGIQIDNQVYEGQTGQTEIINMKRSYYQYPSPDPQIGEFNAQKGLEYKEGLKKATRGKIEGLLIDLATAPERWTSATGINHYDLLPVQVYTKLQENVNAVSPFISRKICYSANDLTNNSGCGYGPVSERDKSGFWANQSPDDISFWDHVHVGY